MNTEELSNEIDNIIYNVKPYIPMIRFMDPVQVHKQIIYWRRSLILFKDMMYNKMIKSKKLKF